MMLPHTSKDVALTLAKAAGGRIESWMTNPPKPTAVQLTVDQLALVCSAAVQNYINEQRGKLLELPEPVVPEGDWFVRDCYIKEYAANYTLTYILQDSKARLGEYVSNFAIKAGWVEGDGEGALEYIQRISYSQGLLDAIAQQGQPRGWLCQSRKYAAQRCIAMNPQVSDNITEVTPLYAGIVSPL